MEPEFSGGVVFWDIHSTQFSGGVVHTVTALLLGLGKRRHAYFLTLDRTAAQHIQTVRGQRADSGEAGEGGRQG